MEQPSNEFNAENSYTAIRIPKESIHFFKETGKWTKLLAILGFIFIGLMVLAALTMGTLMSSFSGEDSLLPFSGVAFGAIYIAMALLYYFPVMYLYKFSKNIKQAFITMDAQTFNAAIESLKSHYKYIGIFTVVILSFYALGLISFLIVAMIT